MSVIHIMSGIPGSGKSTWIKNYVKHLDANGISNRVISRDEIRKSLVGEDVNAEQYFSREKDVFDIFMMHINVAIAQGVEEIFVDATHINQASRNKVLHRIKGAENYTLAFEVFIIDEDVAQERNAQRTGFAKVPEAAIHKMAKSFQADRGFNVAKGQFASVIVNKR